MVRSFARLAGALALACGSVASAQLRVCAWNITNYVSGREAALQTVFYGQVPAGLALAGQRMAPDVVGFQEISSSVALNNLRNMLNGAPGSPGDWEITPFSIGPDTTTTVAYRSSKLEFLQQVLVSVGQLNTPGIPPRNTYRYDFRLRGYTGTGAVVSFYVVHMKSGDTSDDQAKRLTEARRIRDNAETLGGLFAGGQFLVMGDFNIQTSSQAAYQELVGFQPSNAGRVFDPIARPGTWNNSGTFAMIHTQDPKGAGGMDDRHDQILVGGALLDGAGFDYVGRLLGPQQPDPWDLSTFADPDHSYRAWGNDGSQYNLPLRIAGNTMVGATIAQAIWDTIPTPNPNPPTTNPTVTGGHLPVILDLRVPARVGADTLLDFGSVAQNAPAPQRTLTVSNSGDTALWGVNGIASLSYTLAAPAPFSAPAGTFVDGAGGGVNTHTITMSTAAVGAFDVTLTIAATGADVTARTVRLVGTVTAPPPACGPDLNGDGELTFDDIQLFVSLYNASDPRADFNNDGEWTFDDIQAFIALYNAGC